MTLIMKKTESGLYIQYKDTQDEIRQSSRHYDIDRRKEISKETPILQIA